MRFYDENYSNNNHNFYKFFWATDIGFSVPMKFHIKMNKRGCFKNFQMNKVPDLPIKLKKSKPTNEQTELYFKLTLWFPY